MELVLRILVVVVGLVAVVAVVAVVVVVFWDCGCVLMQSKGLDGGSSSHENNSGIQKRLAQVDARLLVGDDGGGDAWVVFGESSSFIGP
jgi:hypothetical protein